MDTQSTRGSELFNMKDRPLWRSRSTEPRILGILRGKITAPTAPPEPTETNRQTLLNQAEMACFKDAMPRADYQRFEASNYQAPPAGQTPPTMTLIETKLVSITAANAASTAKEQQAYRKEVILFTTSANRIWTYLKAFVHENARAAINELYSISIFCWIFQPSGK